MCTHKPSITSSRHEPTSAFFWVKFSPFGDKKKSSATHTKDFCEKIARVTRFQGKEKSEIPIFR
jgi:hypothetical protein